MPSTKPSTIALAVPQLSPARGSVQVIAPQCTIRVAQAHTGSPCPFTCQSLAEANPSTRSTPANAACQGLSHGPADLSKFRQQEQRPPSLAVQLPSINQEPATYQCTCRFSFSSFLQYDQHVNFLPEIKPKVTASCGLQLP
eukprot:1747692-Rhodomonas_salina.2